MPRRVGVLGGMGPQAAAVFAQYLVNLTPVQRDQDHIPVILINDPTIPERTSFLLGQSSLSPVPKLLSIARDLEKMGAELISIPCNTVHAFWPDVARAVAVPVLNIVDETARRIESEAAGSPVGILATRGTICARLYQEALASVCDELVLPPEELQGQVQVIIEAVKANQDRNQLAESLTRVVDEIERMGAETVVLACTELSLIRPESNRVPLLDSLEILAEATVEQAFLGES